MDFQGEVTSEEAKKRKAQEALQEARVKLYLRIRPENALKIESSLRPQPSPNSSTSFSHTPSKTPSSQTSELGSEAHGSETSRSSVEVSPRRPSPSPREESRPPFESTRNTWDLWDNSVDKWPWKQHEAHFRSGKNALRIVTSPIVNFWLEHDLLRNKNDIGGLLDMIDVLCQANSIDNCTEIVIRHLAFQRKFLEIAKLEEQRRELNGPDYINRLNVVASELFNKTEGFFHMLIKTVKRHKKMEKRRYEEHRDWNQSRAQEGRGNYPGLSRGLPSPLRYELNIDDSCPDQSSYSTDETVNGPLEPENNEEQSGTWGPNNPDDVEW
ncbi:hypothetical protein F4815DRAFT_447741 [Daldinia loculata]|nr:hypothetical protein F4815DRAFT_447741 [Daldinia loculata]